MAIGVAVKVNTMKKIPSDIIFNLALASLEAMCFTSLTLTINKAQSENVATSNNNPVIPPTTSSLNGMKDRMNRKLRSTNAKTCKPLINEILPFLLVGTLIKVFKISSDP